MNIQYQISEFFLIFYLFQIHLGEQVLDADVIYSMDIHNQINYLVLGLRNLYL